MLPAGLTFYQILWYFLIYSMVGWCLEVIYHAVSLGKIINRGFLNGPVCPVYGFGMIIATTLASSVSTGGASSLSVPVLFFGGMILATLVELVAGWLLDKIFHARWWDYSEFPFNFHGYICLKFSLMWGVGAVLIMKLVHPVIERSVAGAIRQIPVAGWVILAVCYAAYLADAVVTVLIVVELNKRLAILDDMRSSMRVVSDKMSNVIGKSAMGTAQRIDTAKVQTALAKAELVDKVTDKTTESVKAVQQRTSDLQRRIDEITDKLLKRNIFGVKRLLAAFPDLYSERYKEALEMLKDKWKNLRG